MRAVEALNGYEWWKGFELWRRFRDLNREGATSASLARW
jgi:hypothetical protein